MRAHEYALAERIFARRPRISRLLHKLLIVRQFVAVVIRCIAKFKLLLSLFIPANHSFVCGSPLC